MRTFLTITFLFLLSTASYSQGTGFEVLGISPTPFSLSKAEATTSVSDGSASIYLNPALLVYNPTSSIDLGYSFWIANISNIFGGVNFKKENRAFALAFYTSGADDFEQRDNPGPSNGDFSIQYTSLSAAYARDFGYFSLGGAVQYLNENNFTFRANGYAFNFGAASRFLDDMVRVGASVSNLGEMEELNIERTPLPSNFKIGTSADIVRFNPPKNDDLPVLVTLFADYVHPLQETSNKDFTDFSSRDPYFNIGIGFTIAEALQVSGGYKTEDNARPISFGAAFDTDELTFNYALIPFNTGYGTVHSIGIQYKFN